MRNSKGEGGDERKMRGRSAPGADARAHDCVVMSHAAAALTHVRTHIRTHIRLCSNEE